MRIVFRTDASLQIGTGHVMRCIILAEALRERGADCRFICRDFTGNLFDRIRQSGFEVFSLPGDVCADRDDLPSEQVALAHGYWLGVDYVTDATQTLAALEGHRCDWLIVDHYLGLVHGQSLKSRTLKMKSFFERSIRNGFFKKCLSQQIVN